MSKYLFTKNSSLERPKNISHEAYMSASYGDEFIYEPKDVPLRSYHFSGSWLNHSEKKLFSSLKNTINFYRGKDDLYNYDFYSNNPLNLLCFNVYHLGSGFSPGSIKLNMYYTGSIVDTATDSLQNGVLYNKNKEKVGIALYKEGFIILNNTGSLNSEILQFSSRGNIFNDNLRWVHFWLEAEDTIYCDIDYQTINDVTSNTYFAPVEKYDLNFSNNSTYIQSGTYKPVYDSFSFKENEDIIIKNTSKSPFVSGSSNFEKQTFITKVGLYDKEKKLIAVGNLANPVRKTEEREFIFKLRLDI